MNSSASGYLNDVFEGIDKTFTDFEMLSTSKVNVLVKAKRYGRWWMLKGLNEEVRGEAAYQQRLRKELEIMSQLQHPNIVSVAGLEEVDGLGGCIVMEYVDGHTLEQWLEGNPSQSDKKRVMQELIEAVSYMHKKNIVHRDLKPTNILITYNGKNVRLIDFGLADTDSHAILKQPAGTPQYMSYEQANSSVPDVRNDIYSIGVIMQQMGLRKRYAPIIKRCIAPIEQRYQHTFDLQEAFSKAERKYYIIIGVCGIAFIACLFILFGQHQTQDQQDIIIENGMQLIDEWVGAKNMDEHFDTLSSIIYLRSDFVDIIDESNKLVPQYINQLGKNLSESDKAIISTALYNHLGKYQLRWMEKFNTIKEAYDNSTTTAGH